jgi:hypothetical protein
MEILSGAPLYGRLMALPANIIQGSKVLLGTNTLAYLSVESLVKKRVLLS